jgi:hypothetical protein
MEEQLSLWAGGDALPAHAPTQESTKPVQERSLHDEFEQELLWVMEWAQQHGWWKLSYLEWDGSWKHIGPGKERWDALPSHLGTYDVGRAFHFAKQWEVLETRPGVVAGEFVVDVPSLLPLVDCEWGQRQLLELGAECDYWPIHWCIGQKWDVLLFGLPCWQQRVQEATVEWISEAIRAVELYIELSQTSIVCASCKKPNYFPGLTLEQVRERFQNSTCGMCLRRMFAREVPL